MVLRTQELRKKRFGERRRQPCASKRPSCSIHTNTNTIVSTLVCTKIDAGDMDERMSMEAWTRNDRLGLGEREGRDLTCHPKTKMMIWTWNLTGCEKKIAKSSSTVLAQGKKVGRKSPSSPPACSRRRGRKITFERKVRQKKVRRGGRGGKNMPVGSQAFWTRRRAETVRVFQEQRNKEST